MAMEVRMFTVGPVQENCFMFGRAGSDAALIVDPGDEAPRILAAANHLVCVGEPEAARQECALAARQSIARGG